MPAAALVVHQARYSLAYGSRANAELAAQGHSYLHSVVPWAIFALAAGAASLLRRLARAARTGDAGSSPHLPFLRLWGATAVALVAIYAVQETLEGFVASGHPGGIASSSLGHGGWWAVPVSALVALAVVALLRVARAAVRYAASLAPRIARRTIVARRPSSAALVPVPVLARAAAGRAPPR
jgi:hypothetical protein